MKDGKKIACKIPDMDEKIISILSDLYNWKEDAIVGGMAEDDDEDEEFVDDCICPNCSKGNRTNAKFCRFCGNQIIQ